jgi:DNA-binding transcriptional ArsR family regulator
MLSNEKQQQTLDLAFVALSNNKRRAMLTTLSFRPATVQSLAKEHSLSLAAIHRHIRVLEEAKLIQRRKIGRVNFVAINRKALKTVQQWIMNFRTDWGNDNETLENYIEVFKAN